MKTPLVEKQSDALLDTANERFIERNQIPVVFVISTRHPILSRIKALGSPRREDHGRRRKHPGPRSADTAASDEGKCDRF
jgi:hypothetical protein